MKTRTFLAATLLLLNIGSSFGYYSRTTMNGGPNGYYCTSKEVDNAGNTEINCEDPGNSSCPLRPANPNHTHLVDVAVEAIMCGQLSGSYTDEGGTIYWVSDNRQMSNSKIIID